MKVEKLLMYIFEYCPYFTLMGSRIEFYLNIVKWHLYNSDGGCCLGMGDGVTGCGLHPLHPPYDVTLRPFLSVYHCK